ncbi:MAG: glycosyltransferase family 4 protein [Candidatus Hodarchaeota archaeon]
MHILMISQWFPPHVSGGSIRTFNAAKGLALVGHEVTVITPLPPPPFVSRPEYSGKRNMYWGSINGIRVIRTWSPFLQDLGLARRLILFICFMVTSLFPLPFIRHVDVVWAVNPPIFSIFPALIYKAFSRCALFRDVPDLWPEAIYDLGLIKSGIIKPILDFISKVSYLVADGVTSISAGYLRVLKKQYGLTDDRLHFIEIGVDTNFLHPYVVESNNSSPYRLNKKFIVMYSGNLGIQYDFSTVLEAAKLLKNYNDIFFVIRGWGVLKNFIQENIKEFNNVLLDTEVVDKQKICQILNYADVFLLPMKPLKAAEMGLPTKLLEYQACGKPVIVCTRGEPALYIRSTDSGIVVSPNDPRALSEAILELYRNKEKRERLGENGWKHVSEHLALKKIGERFSNIMTPKFQEASKIACVQKLGQV